MRTLVVFLLLLLACPLSAALADQKVNSATPLHQVEIYVTDWCPYCKKAIAFFESKNIPFTLYDIEKDRAAYLRKLQLDGGRRGVPFAMVNGHAVHGYSEAFYLRALNMQ